MIINNKKGAGIEWWFLILAVAVGAVIYFINILNPNQAFANYIGQYQFSIIKPANEAELTLFYIDQSAKYSLQQAIYYLAKNGGNSNLEIEEPPTSEPLPKDIGCGDFYGYAIWYQLKEGYIDSCIDEDETKFSLENLFKDSFYQYLLKHPYNIPIDYDYEITGSLEVIGKAKRPIKLDILKDETKKTVREATKTPEGLIDFTGTGLCAEGKTCLLTQEAFEKLKKAQQRAEEKGVSLEVYDSYRSKEQLIQEWESGRFSYIKDEKIRRLYVCYPYGDDVEQRCPHATGKAVDIRIKGKDDLASLKKIMTEDKLEDRWIRYKREHEEHHFECCGTARYARAKELEEKTGQSVIEIV